MSNNESHRWAVGPGQFAIVIHQEDVPGFFSKKLIIDPGTRALIVEQGQFLGDVGPGTYTLESLSQRLAFWRPRQITAILTRQEDFALRLQCVKLPTAENLIVNVDLQLDVQIDDIALFSRNLMGTRVVFTSENLVETVSPLIQQALWNAIGKLSITELTGPECREQIDAAIEQALTLGLRRYGLKFSQVEYLEIIHEKYDEQRRKVGEAWLQRAGLEQQKTLDQIYSDEELQRIRRQERENELFALADSVAIDREASGLAAELRRIGIRNDMRAAVQSEVFDKIRTQEDMQVFLHTRDKDRLLRTEELESLTTGFQERREDHESARRHLLAKLDVEQRMEIDRVREQLDHAMKLQRVGHEIELARQTSSRDNEQWRQQVELERQQVEHQRQQRDAELQQQHTWFRQESSHRQESEWQELLHGQRTDRLRGEIELAQTERRSRLSRVDSELKGSLAADQLEMEKRRKEWELEVANRESSSQLERLQAVQRINHDSAKLQLDLQERQLRLQSELDNLREDRAGARQISRLQTMSAMSTEALIATADTSNAALLADLKKHDATQQALTAQGELDRQKASLTEQTKWMQQLTDAERAKADAIAAAYRDSMEAQRKANEQMVDALRDIGTKAAGVVVMTPGGVPVAATMGMAPTQPAAAKRVLVCGACRTENTETARFCSSCGTQL